MWDRETFVSRHPSLWKPGAASPRPSNEAPRGAGRRAIVRDFGGCQQERGRVDHSALLDGRLDPLPWLGWQGEEGRQRGQDQAGSERQRPRDKGRERLTEID